MDELTGERAVDTLIAKGESVGHAGRMSLRCSQNSVAQQVVDELVTREVNET